MADTQRTRAALLALFADNVTGNISAQDFRDFLVTVMEADFANPGDFWKQPEPDNLTTDKTVKGWLQYSQTIGNYSISFGRVLYMTSGGWVPAGASATADHAGVFGVAADSYASNTTTATILRRGLVFNTSQAALFSGRVGNYVFLGSGATGSLASGAALPASTVVLGYVERSTVTDLGTTSSKWRFEPGWGVTTV